MMGRADTWGITVICYSNRVVDTVVLGVGMTAINYEQYEDNFRQKYLNLKYERLRKRSRIVAM